MEAGTFSSPEPQRSNDPTADQKIVGSGNEDEAGSDSLAKNVCAGAVQIITWCDSVNLIGSLMKTAHKKGRENGRSRTVEYLLLLPVLWEIKGSSIADFHWNVLSEKFYVAVTFGSEIPTCDWAEIGDVKRCSRWKELRKRYVFVTFYDNASVLPPGTKSYYIESEVQPLGFK